MKNRSFVLLLVLITSVFACRKDPQETPQPLKMGALTVHILDAGVTPEANLPLAPVKGALVVLKNEEGKIDSALSNVGGEVFLCNIVEGRYEVEITKEGYRTIRFENVVVQGGKTNVLKSDFFDCVFMPTSAIAKKRWTVIHFVNLGDLTINNDIISDIRMIEKNGGSSDNVNHVLYIPATSDYSEQSRISYLIKPKFNIENEQLYDNEVYKVRLFSPTYTYDNYDYSMANPSDYKLLEKSVQSIGALFPSDSLMLFIYGHGTGIDISSPQSRSISLTRDPYGEITVPQLREVLSNSAQRGHKISALIMAACKMASFEMAYELDGFVDYIVASEDRSLGINYGADSWVDDFGEGLISAGEMCRRVVRGVGDVNAFATYDMRYFGELKTRFNVLAQSIKNADMELIKPIVKQSMKVTIGSTLNDLIHSCYDLADFTKNISQSELIDADLRLKATSVYDYLKEAKEGNFISEFHCQRSDYARGRGMGVLLRAPDQSYTERNQEIYRQHKYYQDGNRDWDEFLVKLESVSQSEQ